MIKPDWKNTQTVEFFSMLMLMVLFVANPLAVYLSFLPGMAEWGVYWWFLGGLYLFFCFVQARWNPKSRALAAGCVYGLANYTGSFFLGLYAVVKLFALLGREALIQDYWPESLYASLAVGLLIHTLAAVPIFRLVRRWGKSGF